jgi:alpha-D-ribose 1-methylphosphonate 5-triphosphate synthase subunit PhnI
MSMVIKGGEPAIHASHRLIEEQRRGDTALPPVSVSQIGEQLRLGVDRVMCEGALYDRRLGALAIKQAQGDVAEAVFLLRAFRTTLRRFGVTRPIDTARIQLRRRVATIYKEPPGGQYLGPTYDYTHRMLDFSLLEDEAGAEVAVEAAEDRPPCAPDDVFQSALDALRGEGLLEPDGGPATALAPVADLTREPLQFPAGRDLRLQALARGDEGFLLGLAYSALHGYGRIHPYVADLRIGEVEIRFLVPELGFDITVAEITVTECQTVNPTVDAATEIPYLTRGYGLVFGQSERKALSVALLDRALRAGELGEDSGGPAQDEAFVLSHADSVESAGLIQHLKLPHYVDFEGQMQVIRRLRAARTEAEAAE